MKVISFLSLARGFSVSYSFTVVKSCLGSLCTSLGPSGARKSQIHCSSLSTCHNWMNSSGSLCGHSLPPHTPPSGHPQPVTFFFYQPIFRNSLPNECWPIPFPAIKTGSGGRRCLENVVIIAYTHTYAEAPLQ